MGDPGAAFDRAQAREAPGLHHHRNIRLARRVADTLGFIPAGTKTGPVAWTGGELAFSFTIPLEGGMTVRTRLTAQGAALKGRWEDVKGANSEPAELAFSLRSQTRI